MSYRSYYYEVRVFIKENGEEYLILHCFYHKDLMPFPIKDLSDRQIGQKLISYIGDVVIKQEILNEVGECIIKCIPAPVPMIKSNYKIDLSLYKDYEIGF